jgi:hypothetical protein
VADVERPNSRRWRFDHETGDLVGPRGGRHGYTEGFVELTVWLGKDPGRDAVCSLQWGHMGRVDLYVDGEVRACIRGDWSATIDGLTAESLREFVERKVEEGEGQ